MNTLTAMLAIATIVAAVGVAGTLAPFGTTTTAAYASQYGSCHQAVNGNGHFVGIPGKDIKEIRTGCEIYK
jgi:hypothetical protein